MEAGPRLEPFVRVADGVTPDLPGIYTWTIANADGSASLYVGKYKRRRRPEREYRRNVARLLAGRPYRLGKPDRFRRIHRALELAVRESRAIVLTFLENVPLDRLAAREAELIRALEPDLNGEAGGRYSQG